MFTASSFRVERWKMIFFLLLCLWLGGLLFWLNNPSSTFQRYQIKGLPFGFFTSPKGGVLTHDFSYNRLYLEGIRAHLIPRPYRLEDQETWMRKVIPNLPAGMSHAYSPVALVLAWPLLQVPGAEAYFIYCLLSAVGILLLFYFYLLPRADHPLQVFALAVCVASVGLSLAFSQGQSSLVTTSLLGAFWALLRRRDQGATKLTDFWLALFFWAIWLKPSVAIIPFILFLGARAWRPLVLGLAFLGLTWISLAGFYGGWRTGFWDYLYLLNHYDNADFTPFMRMNYVPGHDEEIRLLFAFDRAAILTLALALLVLKWKQLVTLPELFQGMIGIFLLFSPYLVLSENWLLCLLIVEGSFFRSSSLLMGYGKLLVLFGIFDLRVGLIVPWQINFQLKCLLFGWMLAEALSRARRSGLPSAA